MFETMLADRVGPFHETVPRYDYWSTAHSLAAERMQFAVGSSILLTVFTGDAGSGKSTIVRRVVSDAQGRQLIGVCKHGPAINTDPCRAILDSFGAGVSTNDQSAQKRILQQSLEAARAALGLPTFIMDDAEKLEPKQFSDLFDLARLSEGPERALFKIILVGRPEATEQLDDELGLLLGPTFSLQPMDEKDTAGYVEHRLKVAGLENQPFSDDALKAIYERTQGNPRQINLLCQTALAEAEAAHVDWIDAKRIQDCTFASSGHSDFVQTSQAAATQQSVPPTGVNSTGAATVPARPPRLQNAEADAAISTAPQTANDSFFDAIERAKAELRISEGLSSKPEIPTSAVDGPPNFKTRRSSADRPPQRSEAAKEDFLKPSLRHDKTAEPMAPPAPTNPSPSAASASMSKTDAPPSSRKWPVQTVLAAGVVGVAALFYLLASSNQERAELSVDNATAAPGTDTATRPAFESPAATDTDPAKAESAASSATRDIPAPIIDYEGPANLLPPIEGRSDDASPALEVFLDPSEVAPMLALAQTFGDLPQNPEGWYRRGLFVADQDAVAAAVAYTVAAGQGHPRAAYFLGQMYEIGEGVPVNNVLAKHWYGVVGENVAAAAERFALLDPAEDAETTTPVPLFSFLSSPGEAVLVWTSATGPSDITYTVEFSDAGGQVISRIEGVTGSFLRQSTPEAVRYWRVATHAKPSQAALKSGWVPLDLQTETGLGVAATDP